MHPRLIGYWDQIWVLLFTPNKKSCWKPQEECGQVADPFVTNRTKKALRSALLQALNPAAHQDMTDKDAAEEPVSTYAIAHMYCVILYMCVGRR